MSKTANHLNHSVWDCKYHVVFIPKYRKKVLFGRTRSRISGPESDQPQLRHVLLDTCNMSDNLSTDRKDPQRNQLIWTLAQITGIWIMSDIGFSMLLPALGVQSSYNAGSIAITLYYIFWTGIAVITFWPLYTSWPSYAKWGTFENPLTSYIVWSLSFVACIFFAAYVLPSLPPAPWTESWTPPEIRVATPQFFLPLSINILFQQFLIVALVLGLSSQQYSISRISAFCSLAFGVAHISLFFWGMPLGYVIRIMVVATAFGFAFPYLIMRVPNGLAYSYIVHWLYYAVTTIIPHIFNSSPS